MPSTLLAGSPPRLRSPTEIAATQRSTKSMLTPPYLFPPATATSRYTQAYPKHKRYVVQHHPSLLLLLLPILLLVLSPLKSPPPASTKKKPFVLRLLNFLPLPPTLPSLRHSLQTQRPFNLEMASASLSNPPRRFSPLLLPAVYFPFNSPS